MLFFRVSGRIFRVLLGLGVGILNKDWVTIAIVAEIVVVMTTNVNQAIVENAFFNLQFIDIR